MKRINLKILLVVLLGMVCFEANAYVFSANYQGNAIYYNIDNSMLGNIASVIVTLGDVEYSGDWVVSLHIENRRFGIIRALALSA